METPGWDRVQFTAGRVGVSDERSRVSKADEEVEAAEVADEADEADGFIALLEPPSTHCCRAAGTAAANAARTRWARSVTASIVQDTTWDASSMQCSLLFAVEGRDGGLGIDWL